MLAKIKDSITGWVAYAIVGVLAVPFALWGIQSYFVSSSPVIMTVDGDEITRIQFEDELARTKRNAQDSIDAIPSERELINRALSNIYSRLLVRNAAEEYGYHVSDLQLAEFIESAPEFQDKNGAFSTTKYREFISVQQTSRSGYETNLRLSLENQQFLSQAAKTSFTLRAEQKEFEQLAHEERKVHYLLVDNEHYIDPKSINDEEILKQYEDNPQKYSTELEFQLRYVEMTLDSIIESGQIDSVTDEDVAQSYEENLDRYVTPEIRTVSHILLDPETHDSDTLKERIQIVQDKLNQGGDFATLAKTYSDDFLTAKKGGKLPPLNEFDIEEDAVRNTIFTMEEGTASEPVESKFGTQIFKLESITPEVQLSLEASRDEIATTIAQERAQEEYAVLMEQMVNFADVSGATLFSDFEKNLNMPSTVTQWLTPNSRESIFAHTKVRDTAFNRVFPGKSLHSGPVEVSEGEHLIFYAIEEAETPVQRPLAEVKDDIRDELLLAKAQVKAREQVDQWLQELKDKKKKFNALAKLKWTESKNLGYIGRFATEDVSERIAIPAFSLPYDPAQQKKKEKAYTLTSINNRLGIIEVSGMRYDQEAKINRLSFSARETQAMVESLETLFKTVINEENIKQLSSE